MKKYILNSAVITNEGAYVYKYISLADAKTWLADKNVISTIGYPETAIALQILTGVVAPVSRKQIKMEQGDEALVFRLIRRLDEDETKGEVGVEELLKNSEIGLLKRLV